MYIILWGKEQEHPTNESGSNVNSEDLQNVGPGTLITSDGEKSMPEA